MTLWQLFKEGLGALFRGGKRKKIRLRALALRARQEVIGRVMAAHRQGDYEGALRHADALEPLDVAVYHFFRGEALLHLGRLAEAETHLSKSASLPQPEGLRAIAYSTLGQVLVELQRSDEAMQCFEKSMKCAPNRGATDRGLAELMLRGGDSAEGMKWARRAVEKTRASTMSAEVRDLNLGEALAVFAWATAAASADRNAVDRAAEEAVSLVQHRDSCSSRAQVHFHLGTAYKTLEDSAAAKRQFEAAAAIDPNGHWGRAARATRAAFDS